jgi:hypothetical protein
MEMEASAAFYMVSGVRWQSIMAAPTAVRGARYRCGVLLRVDGGEDEDEDFVFDLIHESVHGLGFWAAAWAERWAAAGLPCWADSAR